MADLIYLFVFLESFCIAQRSAAAARAYVVLMRLFKLLIIRMIMDTVKRYHLVVRLLIRSQNHNHSKHHLESFEKVTNSMLGTPCT